MHPLRLAFFFIALVAAAPHAQAQSSGDPQKGGALARRVCAECHAVVTRDTRSPNSQSPSFVEIASAPGMTAAALNAALHTSHTSMPNLILRAGQTRNIIAYILSLKK